MVDMPEMKWFDKIEWENPTKGYFLTDVKQKTLWKDEKTGATWVLLKLPPGLANEVHKHNKANQFMYFLSGAIDLGENNILEFDGKLAAIAEKGDTHGGTNFHKETLALYFYDGSPEQEFEE